LSNVRVRGAIVACCLALPLAARADVSVEDYAVYARQGRTYMAEQQWNLAVEQLQKAVHAKNDDDRVWTDLGDALAVDPRGVQFGSPSQNEQAAAAYQRATQLNPGDARAWNNLAWLRAKTKTALDQGLEAALRAVELEERAGYLDTLAEVRFARGEMAEAIEVAERAMALEPEDSYFQKQYDRFLGASTATPTPTAAPAKKSGGKKPPSKKKART
jgi:Flp pilus assembly protein TadD